MHNHWDSWWCVINRSWIVGKLKIVDKPTARWKSQKTTLVRKSHQTCEGNCEDEKGKKSIAVDSLSSRTEGEEGQRTEALIPLNRLPWRPIRDIVFTLKVIELGRTLGDSRLYQTRSIDLYRCFHVSENTMRGLWDEQLVYSYLSI